MNLKQQAFVAEMLRHGDKIEAYRTAYPSKSDNHRSIESAANRLLQHPDVWDAIHIARDRIYAEVEEELKGHMLKEVLSAHRKREILAQIAEGVWMEQAPPDHIHGKPTCVQIPTIKERLKAIDMDNRMAGEYVHEKPVKKETTREPAVDNAPEPPANEDAPAQKQIKVPAPCAKIRNPFIIPVIPYDPQLNRPYTAALSDEEVQRIKERVKERINATEPEWMRNAQACVTNAPYPLKGDTL